MFKKILIVMLVMALLVPGVAIAASSTPIAQVSPELVLKVNVDNSEIRNVTYTAYLRLPTSTVAADDAFESPVKVEFYSGEWGSGFPNKLIGEAAFDAAGKAVLKFQQEAGRYIGGAIALKTPYGECFSNIVVYSVDQLVSNSVTYTAPRARISQVLQTQQVIPSLVLRVLVDQPNSTTVNRRNVTYMVQLAGPAITTQLNEPIKIDFYSGSAADKKYPSEYLGSAYMDNSGQAKLQIYQEPGRYMGGSIAVDAPWGTIRSNTTYYVVTKDN